MNVYEKICNMTEDEMTDFIFRLYNKGWSDGASGVDDEEYYYQQFLREDADNYDMCI